MGTGRWAGQGSGDGGVAQCALAMGTFCMGMPFAQGALAHPNSLYTCTSATGTPDCADGLADASHAAAHVLAGSKKIKIQKKKKEIAITCLAMPELSLKWLLLVAALSLEAESEANVPYWSCSSGTATREAPECLIAPEAHAHKQVCGNSPVVARLL